MDKIKRRDFLKLVGWMAVYSPSLLKSKGLTPGLTHPVDIFQDITGIPDSPFLDEMREYCDEPVLEIEIRPYCTWIVPVWDFLVCELGDVVLIMEKPSMEKVRVRIVAMFQMPGYYKIQAIEDKSDDDVMQLFVLDEGSDFSITYPPHNNRSGVNDGQDKA